MPVVAAEETIPQIQDGAVRKRWTREEVARLESLGLFEGQHWELIEGELINKIGRKRKHAALRTVVLMLGRIFGDERVQHEVNIDVAPADNPTSEPEPDVLVTARSYVEFARNPQPDEILLLVEVADSTVRFDRATKARLYVRAGIGEYWVMDARRRRLFVHREPQGDFFSSIVEYEDVESVCPLAAPDQPICVSDLFGPAIAAE